ncbi:MAG: DUF6298 domain-containing protein [Acidobacteriota bacterium]
MWKVVSITIVAMVILLCIAVIVNSEKVRTRVRRASYRMIGAPSNQIAIKPSTHQVSRRAAGPLQRNCARSRYFSDPNGQPVLLVGNHTWYTLQDGGRHDPPSAFDYEKYLQFLQANGVNFFRMFVWEQSKWSEGVDEAYFYSPSAYERTGPGTALDGKPKFDLTKFNQAYFGRLRERVTAAGSSGVYVSIQLFQGFSVQAKPFMAANNPWFGHPFHRDNNINGIDGDANGNGEGEEIQTLLIPAITTLQEEYVGKVIDAVNDLANVLYEICNEAHGDSQEWQEHFIRYVHSYEAQKPKQHPVGMTVEFPGGNNDELFNSSADWVSPNAEGGYDSDPPAAAGGKVVINDTDHLCYPCGDREWMWKSFLRGYNPAFMDPYDCTADWSPSGCDPNDPVWVSLRANLGYAQGYARRMNLGAMAPYPDLASTRYCLANPAGTDGAYLIYLPAGRTLRSVLHSIGVRKNVDIYLPPDGYVRVDLSATSGELSSEWFHPRTGRILNGDKIIGGAARDFKSPFVGDAVLYLYCNRR